MDPTPPGPAEPRGRRSGPLLGAAVLFVAAAEVAAAPHGGPTGMALEAAVRFGAWFLRGAAAAACLAGLGLPVARRLLGRDTGRPALFAATAFVAGWAVLVALAVPLLAVGRFTPLAWIVPAAVGATVAAVGAARSIRIGAGWIPGMVRGGDARTPWRVVVVLVLAVTAVMASAPPDSRDEMAYHLVIPQRWAASGSWATPPGNPHAFFPANAEVLLSWGLALAGTGGPRFLTLLAGLLTLAVLAEIGRWRWPAWSALAALLATPLVPASLAVASSEWPLVLALVAGWLLSRPGAARGPGGSALSWALALGTKYTALPLVGLMVAQRVWSARRTGRAAVRLVLALALAATALALPWYARNAAATGDPVYPFGSLLSREGAAAGGRADGEAIVRYSGLDGAWRVVPLLGHALVEPRVDERLTPLCFLVVTAVVLAGWRRPGLPWAAVTGCLLLFSAFSPSARIFLPVIVLAWMWLPPFLDGIDHHRPARWLWNGMVLLLLALAAPLLSAQWVLVDGGAAVAYLSGQITRDSMLERRGLLTPVVQQIAREELGDARLWIWGEDEVFWFRRWTWSDSPYRLPEAIRLAARGEAVLDAAVARWHITGIVIDRTRIPEPLETVTLPDGPRRPVPPGARRTVLDWLARRTQLVARDGRFEYRRLVRADRTDRLSPAPSPRP